jgi:hypothetical protein
MKPPPVIGLICLASICAAMAQSSTIVGVGHNRAASGLRNAMQQRHHDSCNSGLGCLVS